MCQASYERHRRRQIAYGRWKPRVPADEARAHLEQLRAAGLRPRQVAQLAGVSETTVAHVAQPDWERVSANVERAILAVPIPQRPADVTADNALVPIIGAQRRVQALVAHGYPQAHLARELDMNPASSTMGALVGRPNTASGNTGRTIPAGRDRAIKALFDQLQMTPGPSERARRYGRQQGWPLPFEWDENDIDNPAAQSIRARWTPASTLAERREQVHELTERGLTADQIATCLRVPTYLVDKDRQRGLVTVGAPWRPEMEWGLDR